MITRISYAASQNVFDINQISYYNTFDGSFHKRLIIGAVDSVKSY